MVQKQVAGRLQQAEPSQPVVPIMLPPPTPAMIETRLKATDVKLDEILELLRAKSKR